MTFTNYENYETPKSSSFTERINYDLLRIISANFDEVYPHLGNFKDKKDNYKVITDKKTIKTLLINRLKVKDNTFTYRTKNGRNYGRVYPDGWSLCLMPKTLRHTISSGFNYDIDTINAFLNYLNWYCKEKNVKAENLNYICNNREDFLKKIIEYRNISRSEAKDLVLSALNDQNRDWDFEPNDPMFDTYQEFKRLQDFVAKDNKRIYDACKKTNKNNSKGSCMSQVLQTIENKVLFCMTDFLKSVNISVSSLEFDGLEAYKEDCDNYGKENLLTDLEDHVFKVLTIPIKLAYKDMTLGINHLLEKYEDTLSTVSSSKSDEGENSYSSIKKSFELKHFKCIDNGCYYELLEDFTFKVRSRIELKNSFEHLTYEEIDSKHGIVDKQFIERWLRDKNIRVYKKVDLYPPPLKCPDNHFNLWNGYEIENITINNTYDEIFIQEGFNFIINHWKLLSGDEYFDFFLKYNAYTVQYPGLKTLLTLYINSKPGLGKERGLYYILEQIFGKKYCLITQNINDIFGEFNGLIENKFIIVMDEVKISVSSKFEEEIKSITSSETNRINNKGIKKYDVNNYTHLMGFSNTNGFKIQEGCRRSLPFDRWEVPRPSPEYIDKLLEYTGNKVIIKRIFDYLMSIDVSEFKPDIERPETAYFNELIDASLPIETQFFIYLIENTSDFSVIEHSAIELFGLFKDFLKDCFTDIKYTSSMRSLVIKLNRLGCNGFEKTHKRNGNVWIFDIKKCKEWCQDKGFIKKRLLK
jgi:hypothetical protein